MPSTHQVPGGAPSSTTGSNAGPKKISAWRGSKPAGYDEDEAIRVANEMRKGSEKLDPLRARIRDRLFSVYYDRVAVPRPRPEFLSVVPPAEHLATFQWLFADANLEEGKSLQREYWLATLEEASGQQVQALQRFRFLRSKLPRDGSSRMSDSIDAAITRLSK